MPSSSIVRIWRHSTSIAEARAPKRAASLDIAAWWRISSRRADLARARPRIRDTLARRVLRARCPRYAAVDEKGRIIVGPVALASAAREPGDGDCRKRCAPEPTVQGPGGPQLGN